MKALLRALFVAYLVVLLWLVLFKVSYEPLNVIREYQTRSINLIPFSRARTSEMIANFLAFIPFGVLLGTNYRRIDCQHKIAAILAFSLAVEVTQYALAIGVTDLTDIITNTMGGLVGLAVYTVAGRHLDHRYIDWSVLLVGTVGLIAALYLRVYVFIVRY